MAITGFRSVVGHADVIHHLQKAVESDRTSHAYLISGEVGSGKKTLAEAFALTLMCKERLEGPDACGNCPDCRKITDRNHPDVIWVTHEKPNTISVDEIRQQVVATVDILPYNGGKKIYIIPDAEKMNPQAQNALLKTIEEPPEYAVLLLLSTSQEAMLQTILSRCVKLTLMPVADRLVSDYLVHDLQIPEYEARMLTAFAQGNIGRAAQAATDGGASERRQTVLKLMKTLRGMDSAAIMDAIKGLKDEKDFITEILDSMLMFMRDVFFFKATEDDDHLVFRDEVDLVRDTSRSISYEGLTTVFDALDQARVRIRSNVNYDATLENLFFTIQDALK